MVRLIIEERNDSASIPRNVKMHFCKKCLVEMIPVEKKDTFCSICGKHGQDIIYACPECGFKKRVYEQNYDESMPCCC